MSNLFYRWFQSLTDIDHIADSDQEEIERYTTPPTNNAVVRWIYWLEKVKKEEKDGDTI